MNFTVSLEHSFSEQQQAQTHQGISMMCEIISKQNSERLVILILFLVSLLRVLNIHIVASWRDMQ